MTPKYQAMLAEIDLNRRLREDRWGTDPMSREREYLRAVGAEWEAGQWWITLDQWAIYQFRHKAAAWFTRPRRA